MKGDGRRPEDKPMGRYNRRAPLTRERERLLKMLYQDYHGKSGTTHTPADSMELASGVTERKHLSCPRASVHYDLRKSRWWRKLDHDPEYREMLGRPNPTQHGDPHTVIVDRDPQTKGPRLRLVRFCEPGPLAQRVSRAIRPDRFGTPAGRPKCRGRMVMTVVRELVFDPELVSDQDLAAFTLQLSHEACQLEQESQEQRLNAQERVQEAEQSRLLRDERAEQVHDSCRQLLDNAQRILSEKPFS